MPNDEEKLLKFLITHNLIPREKICPRCGAIVNISRKADNEYFFKCRASTLVSINKKKKQRMTCLYQESVRKNTFFDGSKFSLASICNFVMQDVIRHKGETKFLMSDLGWSRPSVIDWKNFMREVYVDWSLTYNRPTIGGPGKIVEIDEAKVGKRKYNSGRLIEGQWVFGGIERGTQNFFIVPVENRNTETLLAIIKERIADGTTIMSDCWKAYNCLDNEGYRHQAVNHSINFVDPVTEAHTQNVERL